MLVLIKRLLTFQRTDEDSMIGLLRVLDDKNKVIFQCFTLENAGEPTDKSGQDKPIVEREYKLEWTDTSVTVPLDYKPQGLLLTCDSILPKFRDRRILIHIGNTPRHTLGCVLLGNKLHSNGSIEESSIACKKFYDIVKKYGAENFIVRIESMCNGIDDFIKSN